MMGPALTPRRGLFHKVVHPLHEMRRHPRNEGYVYCRTCYILKHVRTSRRWKDRV